LLKTGYVLRASPKRLNAGSFLMMTAGRSLSSISVSS
jgi:hypothetical protein